uniref:Uncharacterized protein n=1 Tax=Ralstonia solanacearum TaxID=305 RepID=A0A0S4X3S7_RALSL|nr:protein of unknown function [Ralstonia solanacearum]
MFQALAAVFLFLRRPRLERIFCDSWITFKRVKDLSFFALIPLVERYALLSALSSRGISH